jgi:hypothetical protein
MTSAEGLSLLEAYAKESSKCRKDTCQKTLDFSKWFMRFKTVEQLLSSESSLDGTQLANDTVHVRVTEAILRQDSRQESITR